MNIQGFIAILFLARNFAHSAHLSTTSYAQHMALSDFYDKVVSHADTIAEAYQGRHLELIGAIPNLETPTGEPLKVLQNYLQIIEDNREAVFGEDSTLQNLVDELTHTFLSTIYKLKFLK